MEENKSVSSLSSLKDLKVPEYNPSLEQEMMTPKITPKMTPSSRRKFNTRQDFTNHNEMDFLCENALGATFNVNEINLAIQ